MTKGKRNETKNKHMTEANRWAMGKGETQKRAREVLTGKVDGM